MVVAAVLLMGCGEPTVGGDAGMLDDAAAVDAHADGGILPVCDGRVPRCPPYYSPWCGSHTRWRYDPSISGCLHADGDGPVTCEPFEPLCPDGSEPTCVEPMTIDGGVVCRGNEAGE